MVNDILQAEKYSNCADLVANDLWRTHFPLWCSTTPGCYLIASHWHLHIAMSQHCKSQDYPGLCQILMVDTHILFVLKLIPFFIAWNQCSVVLKQGWHASFDIYGQSQRDRHGSETHLQKGDRFFPICYNFAAVTAELLAKSAIKQSHSDSRFSSCGSGRTAWYEIAVSMKLKVVREREQSILPLSRLTFLGSNQPPCWERSSSFAIDMSKYLSSSSSSSVTSSMMPFSLMRSSL